MSSRLCGREKYDENTDIRCHTCGRRYADITRQKMMLKVPPEEIRRNSTKRVD